MTAASQNSKSEPESPTPEPSDAPGRADAGDSTVVKYDFTRPIGLSKKFKQNLTTIGESYAKQLGFNLANLLRTSVEVEFKSIEQSLFRHYTSELENPACIGIFSVPPLKGQAAIAVNSKLMFIMLEKLIGGSGAAPDETRDLTEIEGRIFQTVLGKFLADFKEAARRTLDLAPSLSRLETNPSFVNIMTGGEKAIVINVDLTIGEDKGSVTFCFSMSGFEPVLDKIDPKEEEIARTPGEVGEDQEKILSTLNEAPIELVAELGCTSITVDELVNLEVGETLMLDHPAGVPIPIKVSGSTLFLGQPGKSQNRKAVKIVKSYLEVKR